MTELKRDQAWWDRHFLGVAKAVANASKDPSTKIGAIIVRPDRSEVSQGYNGFPKGIADTAERLNDRDQKLELVIHGEENALLKAHENVSGCTMYVWPLFSCAKCALKIIQSGITRVVSPPATQERWKASYEKAMALYDEAGVAYTFIEGEI
ncbi:deoxycytidylate deaminase [Bradyrhizobium phage BDU-MI-1]|nr:deoxycytidylate deaminase [Bradyrhizobium phage BDU-MI-1]